MEHDSSYVKTEIARLHAIIDILINQNSTLQAEISYLKSRNATPDVFSSHDSFEKGRTDSFTSHDKSSKAIPDADNPFPKNDIGKNDANTLLHKSDIGVNDVLSPHPKNDIGRNDALNQLPVFVEATPAVVGKLAHLLKASGVKKVRRSTLTDMAAIIVRGHNKQDCSHQELRKITGHSEGGIAKLLIAMKKRGLIHRAGFKQFGLSAAAREMLRQAVGI